MRLKRWSSTSYIHPFMSKPKGELLRVLDHLTQTTAADPISRRDLSRPYRPAAQ